jgi:DNA-binding MarR family transcriptional regulator
VADWNLDEFVEGLFLLVDRHRLQTVQMDLTPVQALALRLLRREPLPTNRLADALGISASAVTQLTDRLGRKKLIERRTISTDRRAVLVAITERGGRLIDAFQQRRVEVFTDVISRLAEGDREEVIAALGKIAAILGVPETNKLQHPRAPAHANPRAQSRQTANQPAETSKNVGPEPVIRPAKRMRIEWD